MKDYYAILGILPSSEDIVIRAAYKALAQKYHPDRNVRLKNDTNQKMAEINEAYNVLSDPSKRNEYNKLRGVDTSSTIDTSGNIDSEQPQDIVMNIVKRIEQGEMVAIGDRVVLDQYGIHRVKGLLYFAGRVTGTSSTMPWSEYGYIKWEEEDNQIYIKRKRYSLITALPGVFGAFATVDDLYENRDVVSVLPLLLKECATRFG